MLLDAAWNGDAIKTKVVQVTSHATYSTHIILAFGILHAVNYLHLTTLVVALVP